MKQLLIKGIVHIILTVRVTDNLAVVVLFAGDVGPGFPHGVPFDFHCSLDY